MTDEQVYAGVEKALRKYFGKRGDQVVQDNLTCVKRGYNEMQGDPDGDHPWINRAGHVCDRPDCRDGAVPRQSSVGQL